MTRPLLICDADEVLFAFMEAFENFLNDNGLHFTWDSFALFGNILERSSGRAVSRDEVSALLEDFFVGPAGHMRPVERAADTLRELSARCDIVILSNLPHAGAPLRRRLLECHGMSYPLHVNAGPKGRPARDLAGARRGPVFFIDDLAPHHADVARHLPRARRIQFIAHPRLSALAPRADCHLHARNWQQIGAFIGEVLDDAGY